MLWVRRMALGKRDFGDPGRAADPRDQTSEASRGERVAEAPVTDRLEDQEPAKLDDSETADAGNERTKGGPTRDAPAADQPAGGRPAGDEPAGDEPAGDKPAGDVAEPGARDSDRGGSRVEGRPESDDERFPFGRPGRPIRRSSPFFLGFTAAVGVLLAWFLVQATLAARQVIVLIIVSMFLAVGLNPAVEAMMRRGLGRRFAVAIVFACVIAFFVGFGFAIVPPLTEQTTSFANKLPDYVSQLQDNPTINRLDQRYGVLERAENFILSGNLYERLFGGIVGVGKIVLSAFFGTVTVLVLTLYFLASLPSIKNVMYRLAPRSRRDRVTKLGDEILDRVGGYVGGALLIATLAGTSTFVFLTIAGVRFALALALLVALFDLIPLIGATIGAILVTSVAFLESLPIGIACLVFYICYQQIENYLIYPRIMKRTVDVPPTAVIIAALLGGALLGVVGALLAIPTAAAVSLILTEVVMPRQERL